MHSGLRIIFHEVAAQRSHLFHWAPVFIAVGVWVAFTYGWGIGAVCVFVALCVIGTYIAAIGFVDSQALPILVIVTCVALGAGAAIYRSYAVWGPSLSYPYSGDLIGRVVLVDRSAGLTCALPWIRCRLARFQKTNCHGGWVCHSHRKLSMLCQMLGIEYARRGGVGGRYQHSWAVHPNNTKDD